MTHALPHDDAAELALLSAALLDTDRTLTVAGPLPPTAFYNNIRGELWRTIVELHNAGKPADVSGLSINRNGSTGDFQAALTDIIGASGLPALADQYADALRRAHVRRQFIVAGLRLAEDAQHADANPDELRDRIVAELAVDEPVRAEPMNLGTFPAQSKHDPATLLGNRFLCRGGGLLFAGPTGVGKSSFIMQSAILWALGKPMFGIAPSGPLRVLMVQAENDPGDLGEIRDGVFKGLKLSGEDAAAACERVAVVCDCVNTGSAFVRLAERLVARHRPDLLIVDPLLAYLGDAVTEQAAVSAFLRNGINPILQRHGAGLVLVHHVSKPKTGKEKPDWQAGDFAYSGSGSAELGNWARAVIAMRSIGSHDVFEIILGKRGRRAGIVNEDGETVYQFHAKHSTTGICWEPATDADLPDPDETSRASVKIKDVVGSLTEIQPATYSEILNKIVGSHDVSKATAKRAIGRALGSESISKTPAGLYEVLKGK